MIQFRIIEILLGRLLKLAKVLNGNNNPLFNLKQPKKHDQSMGTSHTSQAKTDTNKDKEEVKGMNMNENIEPNTQHITSNNTGNIMDKIKGKDTGKVTDNNTCNNINTVTDTGTYNLLDELVTPSEVMVRHVCYLNQEQSNFVRDMAKQLTKKNKGKKVTESEIFRTAIDYLIKAAKQK